MYINIMELEQKPLSCNLKKQNKRPLEEIIKNYDDLKKQFAGTQWSSFFTETAYENDGRKMNVQEMETMTHVRGFQKEHIDIESDN